MRKKLFEQKQNRAKLREGWVLFFILGIVMLNYPFIHIFNKTSSYFGIPTLILYLFIGWPISIGVIYLFSRIIDSPVSPESEESTPGEEEK